MNRLTAALCISAAVASLALAAHASGKAERAKLGHVEVKSLVLVDDDGRERATLRLGASGGVQFTLLGSKGGAKIALTAFQDEDGMALMEVRSGQGVKITQMATSEMGSVSIQGDTTGMLNMTSTSKEPAAIHLFGRGAAANAAFHVDSSGRAQLVTMDDDRKVTIFIPKQPTLDD